MSITELSVKRPSLVVVIFTVLVFFGLYGYQSLTYELLPDINAPVLTISTPYPGASPNEVESSVTQKIEDAISTLENLEGTQAISMESFSTVIVNLKYGSDIDQAVQSAQRKIDAIMSSLPEEILDPSINKFSFTEMPIMRIGATSNMDEVEFTELFENKIQPEMARIEGVAQVSVIGAVEREIKVNVDGDKLNYYNISLLQVSQAIAQGNLEFPTGSVKDDEQDILVRLSGKIKGLSELRDLVITTLPDGSQVYLHDVAEVYDTQKETQTISRINGKNSLGILITKQSDGNTVEVSKQVQEKMAALEIDYSAENLQFEIAQDSSVFTLEAANSVIFDLLLAVLLVAVIMLFFLHNVRNAIIVMVAIPVSIITTFAFMSLAGFTLNLMTLLALSLVVGILVDDSIVVLENIHARMEKGSSARQAAIETWKEIGLSVTSITLVIIVVFLPIGLVSGIVADLLRQFSLVVVASTAISLLVSFTLTPLLASRFTKLTHLNKKNPFQWVLLLFESFIHSIQEGYRKILKWSLNHKRITMGAIFGLVFASFTLVSNGFIGMEFVAAGDNGEFIVKMELPKETPLEQTNTVSQQVENLLLNDPHVINIFTTVGQGGGGMAGNTSSYLSELNVKLVPAEERDFTSAEYARTVKTRLQQEIPGVKFTASPVSMVGGGGAAPVQVIVQGSDLEEMLAISELIQEAVKKVPGTSEVKSTVEGGNPEIKVDIDRNKMADLGLTLDMVGITMQNAFTGNTDTRFKDGNYEYDIRVQLDAFDRRNMEDIRQLTFLNNKGQLVRLSQFASIEAASGPSRLDRKDKISSLTVEAQVVGRPVGTVGQEVEAMVSQIEIPAGVDVNMGGDLENQTEAFGSLLFALLTSILLVYLIMVALYDNYIHPFVVLFSVPVALIGALLALALAMESMSIFGMLGLIMLVGLVVKNAILIVDFVNQLKREGMDAYEAVIEGTLQRFRPILMTTIAMVIAMVPIAIAAGAGSEWKNGLAWVLIGGLTSSMILTMIIVPVAYRISDIMQDWFGRKFKRSNPEKLITETL